MRSGIAHCFPGICGKHTTLLRSAAQDVFSLNHNLAVVLKFEYQMTEDVVSGYLEFSNIGKDPGDDLWEGCTERRKGNRGKAVFFMHKKILGGCQENN